MPGKANGQIPEGIVPSPPVLSQTTRSARPVAMTATERPSPQKVTQHGRTGFDDPEDEER